MAQLFANNAASLLAASLSDIATTLSVTAGTGIKFPSIATAGADYCLLTLYKIVAGAETSHEIIKVTVRAPGTPDDMTIERAQEGTTALAFSAGDRVELRLTKGSMESLVTPAGTTMLFVQAAAPTGWTKSVTHNNKALRITSGVGAGSGGSLAFTSAFASRSITGSADNQTGPGTVGNTTLTLAQIPSHYHNVTHYKYAANGLLEAATDGIGGRNVGNTETRTTIGPPGVEAVGGGGSHTHTFTPASHSHNLSVNALNLAVQYVDAIIAVKD